MGPYARVKRPYKDVIGEDKDKNPYLEADNTMVPLLAGDPITKKLPGATRESISEHLSSTSKVNGVSANGHIRNGAVPNVTVCDHHKND